MALIEALSSDLRHHEGVRRDLETRERFHARALTVDDFDDDRAWGAGVGALAVGMHRRRWR